MGVFLDHCRSWRIWQEVEKRYPDGVPRMDPLSNEGSKIKPGLWRVWQEVEKRYPDGVPRMDPLDDLGIDEPQALAAVRRMEALEAQLATNAAFLVTTQRACCPTLCKGVLDC